MNTEFPYGLFVMRHCKTEYNLLKKISGQTNSQLVDHQIDSTVLDECQIPLRDFIIISSPLDRCIQTVGLLLAQYCCNTAPVVHIDPRIIERGMGEWEGRLKKAVLSEFSAYNCNGNISPRYTPPNGELFEDFTHRIKFFIHDIKTCSACAPILICAHNQSLKLLTYMLDNTTEFLSFWSSCSFQNGKVVQLK